MSGAGKGIRTCATPPGSEGYKERRSGQKILLLDLLEVSPRRMRECSVFKTCHLQALGVERRNRDIKALSIRAKRPRIDVKHIKIWNEYSCESDIVSEASSMCYDAAFREAHVSE